MIQIGGENTVSADLFKLRVLLSRNTYLTDKNIGRSVHGKARGHTEINFIRECLDRLKDLKEISCHCKGFYRLTKLSVSDAEARTIN